MPVLHYQELLVWQRAVDLVVSVYRMTRMWPSEEQFGLTNQVRRASVSIPSNIAEGQGRATTREFLQYLAIARGSLQEVETQLVVAQRLEFSDATTFTSVFEQTAEVGRLLQGLMRRLRSPLTTDH